MYEAMHIFSIKISELQKKEKQNDLILNLTPENRL